MSTVARWWRPDGTWVITPYPEPFQAALNGDGETHVDWLTAMMNHGYSQIAGFGDTSERYAATNDSIEIYAHGDGDDRHLVVWFENVLGAYVEFFVRSEDIAAFMVDKLPQLIVPISIQLVAAELAKLRVAFAAFVRHGEGSHTLNEEGTSTLEERDRQRRMREERKATTKTA